MSAALKPQDRPGRLGRGATVGVAGLAATVSGHVAAGGALPDGPALSVLAGLSVLVGTAAVGRQLGFFRALGILLLLQPLLHLTLHVLGHHHGTTLPTGAEPATAAPSMTMLVAHLLVAVVLAWWLAAGDTWLREEAARAAQLLLQPSVRAAVPVLGWLPASWVPVPPLGAAPFHGRPHSRRGPPGLPAPALG